MASVTVSATVDRETKKWILEAPVPRPEPSAAAGNTSNSRRSPNH
jgi:hypothetical protein